jgi:transposase-like protein
MTYNTLYERFVDQGGDTVQGYVAYGLYKNAKREWVRSFEATHGRSPERNEVDAHVAGYTPQMISALEAQAKSILVEFADGAITSAKPGIVQDALRGSAWRSIGQSIAANALYTLILIVLAAVLFFAGVDLLGIQRQIGDGQLEPAAVTTPGRPVPSGQPPVSPSGTRSGS